MMVVFFEYSLGNLQTPHGWCLSIKKVGIALTRYTDCNNLHIQSHTRQSELQLSCQQD